MSRIAGGIALNPVWPSLRRFASATSVFQKATTFSADASPGPAVWRDSCRTR